MEKVTIYWQGIVGVNKTEAKDLKVEYMADGRVHMITFVQKGKRKTSNLMTYYTPFIKVVRGWGKPNPPSAWKPATWGNEPGVVVQEAKFSGCSPEWRAEFEEAVKFDPSEVVLSVV